MTLATNNVTAVPTTVVHSEDSRKRRQAETKAAKVWAGVTYKMEIIGPREAHQLLGANTHNRLIRSIGTHTLTRDMTTGNYQGENCEPIQVSKSGVLLNGQHRLKAIIDSESYEPMLVCRGVPDYAQETIDKGSRRTYGDTLSLNEETSANILSAAIRFGWFYENFGKPATGQMQASEAELNKWLNENPDIRQVTQFGHRANRSSIRYTPSVAVTLAYLMARKDVELAETFWEELIDGGTPKGDPSNTLRELLLRDLGSPHRMSRTHRIALTIKAWNAKRDGREVKNLSWRGGAGKGTEDFPKIK